MKIAIVVQARCGSHRLPRKVLAPILGRPMLSYQLERLRAVTGAHEFVVATTWNREDDEIVDLAKSMGWTVVRGSENDVLSRFILAANTVGADAVLRSTGDCPLIDPATVDSIIERFLIGDADHVEIDGLPDGMGAEILLAETLRTIYPLASAEEREHVTLHVRKHPETYRKVVVATGLGLDAERWTVDTEADLALITKLVESITEQNPFLPLVGVQHVADIIAVLDEHPEWRKLNAHIPMGRIDQSMVAANKAIADPTATAAQIAASLASRNAAPHFAPERGDL